MDLHEAWRLCEAKYHLANMLREMGTTARKRGDDFRAEANDLWRQTGKLDINTDIATLQSNVVYAHVDSLQSLATNMAASAKVDFLSTVQAKLGDVVVKKHSNGAWEIEDVAIFTHYSTLNAALKAAISEAAAVCAKEPWNIVTIFSEAKEGAKPEIIGYRVMFDSSIVSWHSEIKHAEQALTAEKHRRLVQCVAADVEALLKV